MSNTPTPEQIVGKWQVEWFAGMHPEKSLRECMILACEEYATSDTSTPSSDTPTEQKYYVAQCGTKKQIVKPLTDADIEREANERYDNDTEEDEHWAFGNGMAAARDYYETNKNLTNE